MAFPSRERLRTAKDFERVFRRSMRIEGAAFIWRVHRKKALPAKVSVVVSKKVAKKASMRNRLRRIVIEWLRTKSGISRYPMDLIVQIKPAAIDMTKDMLYKELKSASSQLRIAP